MRLSRWAAAPVLALFVLVVPAGQVPAAPGARDRRPRHGRVVTRGSGSVRLHTRSG